MDLSICIVNWNTRRLLSECLASVFDELGRGSYRTEVIVVDNASTDGSAEMVEESFAPVTLIRNSENVGFAKANNRAIRQSSGTYLMLLNSDTRVTPGLSTALIEFVETHDQCGAVGPKVVDPDGNLQLSAARFPKLRHAVFGGVLSNELWRRIFPKHHFFAELGLTPEEHAHGQSVDWLLGCCLLLRREAVMPIGLFDESIFMFYEEADLCLRLKRTGWDIEYCPDATIVHYGGGSYRDVWDLDEQVRRQLVGLEYFHRKHYGRLDLATLRFLNFLGSAFKVLAFGLMALSLGSRSRELYRNKTHWHLAALRYHVALAFPSSRAPGLRTGSNRGAER